MKLNVRTIQGDKFTVEVDDKANVLKLKEEIQKVHDAAKVDISKIIFAGKVLENDQTLESCSLKNDDSIVLLISAIKKQETKKEVKKEVKKQDQDQDQDQEIQEEAVEEKKEIKLPDNLSNMPPNFMQMLGPGFMQALAGMGLDSSNLRFEQLDGPMEEGDLTNEQVAMYAPTNIQLNDEEKKDVDSLVELGFGRSLATQCYIACGKNKDDAAIMLLEDKQ